MPNQNITVIEQQENGVFKELVVGKRKKFTPSTANRWYRIVRIPSTTDPNAFGANDNRRVISGTLKIYVDLPFNKTNALVEVDLSAFARGTLTQTTYTTVGNPHVSYLRVARNQGVGNNELVLDMLVLQAGHEITLESTGLLFPDFEDNPQIVGSTQWNVEDNRMPWDSHVMDSQKYGIDTTGGPPRPAAGQTTTVDVSFWFNHKDYSTAFNTDISQNATLNHLDTNSDVYVEFVQDAAGIKAGTYGGTVISTLADNTTVRNAPNSVTGKFRVTVKLRGLTFDTWAPSLISGSTMMPGFYVNGMWILRVVTGVFSGLRPDNPMSGDGVHQASILRLGQGLITNKNINAYHGNLQDPGAPLIVGGRVGYLHGLDLLGGSGRFTSAADHFHLGFIGAVNSGAGYRTPQHYTQFKLGNFSWDGRQQWRNWQMQNANNSDANEIFLGGINELSFGQGAVSGSSPYGIDTTRVELTGTGNGPDKPTSPGPPRWDAEVDFWFNNFFTVSNGQFLITRFPVGVAGIAAAVLSGTAVGTVTGPLTAPDGATGKWKLTIRIQGLNPNEWYPFLADFTTTNSNRWSIESSTPPINPNNQVSLTIHPDRRDKVIATYNQAHNLTLGQNIILNLLNKSFVVSNPARLNCTVSKIIDANTIEILIGTARRLETAMVGVHEFKAPGDHNMSLNLGDTSDFLLLINAFTSDNNIRVQFKANISGTTMTVTEMVSSGYNIEPGMTIFYSNNTDGSFPGPIASAVRVTAQTSGTTGGVGVYTLSYTGGIVGSFVNGVTTLYAGRVVYKVKMIATSGLPEPLVENTDYYVRVSSHYPQYHAWLYLNEADAHVGQTGTTAPTVKFPWKPTYGAYYMVFQDAQNLGATGWAVHIGNTDVFHQQTFADVGWYLHRNVYPNNKGVAQGVITQGIFGGLNSVQWFNKNSFIYGFNCTNQADNTITLGQKLTNKTADSTEVGSTDAIKLRLNGDDIVVSDDTRNLRLAEIFNQNGNGNQLILSANKVWTQYFYGSTSLTIPSGPKTWARIIGGGPSNTTCTVTLPRLGVDGAFTGDELTISLESINNGRSVVLRQYQWGGSSYAATFTDLGTYSTDATLHLRLRDGQWRSVAPTFDQINITGPIVVKDPLAEKGVELNSDSSSYFRYGLAIGNGTTGITPNIAGTTNDALIFSLGGGEVFRVKSNGLEFGTSAASVTRTNLGAAPIASPTFTGTVTIPAGASISGFAPLASPAFSGTPTTTTAAGDTNTTQIATTAFVVGQAGNGTPLVDGTSTAGTSLRYARQDHVHPQDSGKENTIAQGTSISQFWRGDKTWQVPAGAFGPMVLNRFRNLLFGSSNYNPGATAFSTPSSNGFFTMTPFGNTLEGGTFGVGTPRTFNPEVFFGPGSNYRIFAAVRTTSWFNDGVHCMIRSWDGSTQTTVPGLQDFGGGTATGDRIVWATSEPISSANTWFNYAAYFAAYGNNNNSNGATIQDVILTFYKVT